MKEKEKESDEGNVRFARQSQVSDADGDLYFEKGDQITNIVSGPSNLPSTLTIINRNIFVRIHDLVERRPS